MDVIYLYQEQYTCKKSNYYIKVSFFIRTSLRLKLTMRFYLTFMTTGT